MSEDYKHSAAGKAAAEKYKDIINMERPHSSRPHMDLIQRAKIFSPYDALRGFDEAIDAADERTKEVKRADLSEEQKDILSDKLLQVRKGMTVSVRYFVPGINKNTGNYVNINGMVTGIDPVERTLKIQDRTAGTTGGKIEKVVPVAVKFDDIAEIT